jgi:hypothetical protein
MLHSEFSSEIKRIVDGVDKKVDQTLRLAQRQAEASMERDLQSSELSDLPVNTHSTLSQFFSDVSSSQRQLCSTTANTEAGVRTLVEQWQELSPTVLERSRASTSIRG